MGMPYGYPPMQGQPMAYGYPPMQGQSAVPQQDVNVAPAAFQPFAGDVNAHFTKRKYRFNYGCSS